MNFLLYPFIFLSALGLILSLTVHSMTLIGIKVPFDSLVWGLHFGIFIVWIPTIFVSIKLTKNYTQKDFWKTALRGCPKWMKIMVYVFFGYAITNLILFSVLESMGTQAHSTRGTPPSVLRGFSGHWMAFYSISLAILYSAVKTKGIEQHRKCPNGHIVSPSAKFCEKCGCPISNN